MERPSDAKLDGVEGRFPINVLPEASGEMNTATSLRWMVFDEEEMAMGRTKSNWHRASPVGIGVVGTNVCGAAG